MAGSNSINGESGQNYVLLFPDSQDISGTDGHIMKSIILAGGVGTRLWPLSREYYPKQFIQLDNRSLFQQTVERAARL
jgi:hypothetical protein